MIKKNKGFTLIELLVVIAIIALLSTTVMASLNSARSKARDAQRVADIKQLQTALEMYFDKYNTYPPSNTATAGGCNSAAISDHRDNWCRDTKQNNGNVEVDVWIPGMSEFLNPMPHNPKPYFAPSWFPYHYQSLSPTTYWIMVTLENKTKDTCGGGAHYIYNGVDCLWGNNVYVREMK